MKKVLTARWQIHLTAHNPTHSEQLIQLYFNQKHTLDLFLERGAISKEQYDKSLSDLTEKMGMDKPE